MTLRLSTTGMHQQGLTALLRQQSNVARSQLELTTQQKLITAKDDPAGMSQAIRLDHALATLDQQDRDGALLQHRLRSQEQALTDVGSHLDRARELTIQANTGTLSEADRQSIATELRSIRAALIAIGNRDDGAGTRLFAGTRDAVVPFTDNGGVVSYVGNDGRVDVEVGPGLRVTGTDAGSDLFMRVLTGDGLTRGSANAGNTGTAVLGNSSVSDHAAWGGRTLTVHFTAPDTYEVRDAGGTVLSGGTYTPGGTITAQGVQLQLTGTPAAGDGFTIGKAPTRDIFATLDGLVASLEQPAATDPDRATRTNALNAALGDLRTAGDHFLTARAATGTRLAAVDSAADNRSAYGLSLETTLSNLRDVDPAEAAARLSLQATALEAAQKTLIRVQSMSMFDLF